MRGKQVERYMVEQYRPSSRLRPGAWVVIGYFPAVDRREARHLARGATAQPLQFLRATLVGARCLKAEAIFS